MSENQRENIKIILEFVSKIALLVAGIYAIWQYADIKKREYQQPLWETQIKLFFEVSDLTSRLTNEFESQRWEKDKRRFYELYWGSMILVEDESVEKAMVEFGNRLYDFDQIKEVGDMKKAMEELREYAHNVSYACRNSINKAIDRKSPSVSHRKDIRH